MVSDLKELRQDRTLDDVAGKLADYRLEPPDIRVQVSTPDQSQTLYLGAENRVGGTQFARIEGSQQVLVVPKSIYLSVNKDVQSMRNKQVFLGLDRAKLASIEVDKDGEKLFLLKKEGDAWRLAEPIQAAADPDAVEQLANALLTLNVTVFYQEDAQALAPFGLDAPAYTVVLGEKEKAWPRLLIGGETAGRDGLYAKRDDKSVVWVLSKDGPGKIAPTVFSLRDRALVHANRDEVNGVALKGPSGSVILDRSGGKWVCPQSAGKEADAFKVDDLLRGVLALKAERYAEAGEDAARLALEKPRFEVRLTKAKNEVLAEVAIGVAGDGTAYARRLPDGPIAAVDRKLVDALPTKDADVLVSETGAGAPAAIDATPPASAPPGGEGGT